MRSSSRVRDQPARSAPSHACTDWRDTPTSAATLLTLAPSNRHHRSIPLLDN
jgi:hypothetical protein